MTYIICCAKCAKEPDKVARKHHCLQNRGVCYCEHVSVIERVKKLSWVTKK